MLPSSYYSNYYDIIQLAMYIAMYISIDLHVFKQTNMQMVVKCMHIRTRPDYKQVYSYVNG